jgi:hypothetical protein
MSTFTGAPAVRALALGFQEATNGTAAPTAPTAPTADVAPIRRRRRPLFTPSLLIKTISPQSTLFCIFAGAEIPWPLRIIKHWKHVSLKWPNSNENTPFLQGELVFFEVS